LCHLLRCPAVILVLFPDATDIEDDIWDVVEYTLSSSPPPPPLAPWRSSNPHSPPPPPMRASLSAMADDEKDDDAPREAAFRTRASSARR
jgi:hypothetical protein